MILDGKQLAEKIKNSLRDEIISSNTKAGLAVVLVGSNPASQIYVKFKQKACQEIGIHSEITYHSEAISEQQLLEQIEKLNKREDIHGILVQLPLPKHISENRVIQKISPAKDVDCFHPENVGNLAIGQPVFLPCTPAGIVELLKHYQIKTEGQDVVIINKSNIVGKPLALMLLAQGSTVTVCHSKTKNLLEKTRQADIVVSAAGKAKLIKAEMVKPGATVVDVGIVRDDQGKIVGDVDFDQVQKVAQYITPVPGGVGPMTIAMLMQNTVLAARKGKVI